MASPHVAGAAALYWSLNPGLGAAQISQAVVERASQAALSGLDSCTPNRLVNITFTQPARPNPALPECQQASPDDPGPPGPPELPVAFTGMTAKLTSKKLVVRWQVMADAAMGGVLFIDEAYALAGSGDEPADRFAREALDTPVKIMEDSRDSLVVILAGYPEDMQRLLDMNAGLRSRIGRVLTFEDLSDQDLLITFVEQVKQAGYLPGPQSLSPVKALLIRIERGRSFGHARWTRNLVDAAIDAHALRLVDQPDADRDTLETLTFADVASACWEWAG